MRCGEVMYDVMHGVMMNVLCAASPISQHPTNLTPWVLAVGSEGRRGECILHSAGHMKVKVAFTTKREAVRTPQSEKRLGHVGCGTFAIYPVLGDPTYAVAHQADMVCA